MARDHALYRFYDHAGELLYIGITRDPAARWSQHSGDKPWWHRVQRITIQAMPDRASALAAERIAIKAENPRYNVVHREQLAAAPGSIADEKAQRILKRWNLINREWIYQHGAELPPCNCGDMGDPSCGDPLCVATLTAFIEGVLCVEHHARQAIEIPERVTNGG